MASKQYDHAARIFIQNFGRYLIVRQFDYRLKLVVLKIFSMFNSFIKKLPNILLIQNNYWEYVAAKIK